MASYDLLIIGAGPAAWSCAITARQRGLTTAVACAQSATSWLQRAERIDNYPGLPQISGKELLSRFRSQAADMGVVIIEQLARQIMPSGDIYMTLVGNDIIESRAIVLAMGAARPKLLPGEEELLGRGVSWCGTCDGMFYRGKKVAVLSAWTGGVEEAEFLSTLASEVDYYLLAQHACARASRSPSGTKKISWCSRRMRANTATTASSSSALPYRRTRCCRG